MIPKFRAWHTPFKGKKFGQKMEHGRAGTLLNFAEMSPDDYILMQSTGLKDKNGVEIYEGDVIKDSILSKPKDEFFLIVREHNYLLPKLLKNKKVWNNVIDPMMFADHVYVRGVEVIGDIYENPELLEATK